MFSTQSTVSSSTRLCGDFDFATVHLADFHASHQALASIHLSHGPPPSSISLFDITLRQSCESRES